MQLELWILFRRLISIGTGGLWQGSFLGKSNRSRILNVMGFWQNLDRANELNISITTFSI